MDGDKLLDYYFQRRLAGMSYEEISSSLEEMAIVDEEKNFIVPTLRKKEESYLRSLKWRKAGTYILIAGIALVVSSALLKTYAIYSDLNSYDSAFLGLAIAGPLVTFAGYLFRRYNPLLKS